MLMKIKLLSKPLGISVAVILLAVFATLTIHFLRSRHDIENRHAVNLSPLYEPGDRPTTVFIKSVEAETGKVINVGATIRESKSRSNQMKQAVLAYLNGPRKGRNQVPVPEGMSLNEFYFTPTGAAVVDLSTSQVKKEKNGFYEEALFVRGLIDALTSNFFEVKQVKVLVDGQDQETILGHYALGTSEAGMPVTGNNNFKF